MPLANLSPYGHPRSTSSGGTATRDNASVATIAALKAIVASDAARTHGNEVNLADGSRWYFHSSSALTGDDVLVVAPTAGSGRWLRQVGLVSFDIAITYATADAAVLYTMPTGAVLRIHDLIWVITTTFAGGSSSAIGVSSAKTGFSTKGDLLGGATGDLTATLVSTAAGGLVPGTAGAKADTLAEQRALLWVATDTIRFDRITSVYTSGAGSVRIMGRLISNAGA